MLYSDECKERQAKPYMNVKLSQCYSNCIILKYALQNIDLSMELVHTSCVIVYDPFISHLCLSSIIVIMGIDR